MPKSWAGYLFPRDYMDVNRYNFWNSSHHPGHPYGNRSHNPLEILQEVPRLPLAKSLRCPLLHQLRI